MPSARPCSRRGTRWYARFFQGFVTVLHEVARGFHEDRARSRWRVAFTARLSEVRTGPERLTAIGYGHPSRVPTILATVRRSLVRYLTAACLASLAVTALKLS